MVSFKKNVGEVLEIFFTSKRTKRITFVTWIILMELMIGIANEFVVRVFAGILFLILVLIFLRDYKG